MSSTQEHHPVDRLNLQGSPIVELILQGSPIVELILQGRLFVETIVLIVEWHYLLFILYRVIYSL